MFPILDTSLSEQLAGNILKYNIKDNLIISDEEADQISVQDAFLSSQISVADFDVPSSLFYSTLDRLIFMSPVDVVLRVLKANNFIINIENLLSCLEQMRFGVIFEQNEQNSQSIQQFQYSTHFNMPSKSHAGKLLNYFYAEIEAYENELIKLRSLEEASKKGDGKKSFSEILDENKQLKLENQNLTDKIQELSGKLSALQKANSMSVNALENGNILPPVLRLAKVKDVFIEERYVLLRIGKKSIHLPFDLIDFLPEVGELCLVKMIDGNLQGAYFYHGTGRPFIKSMAVVLTSNSDKLKFRDDNRVQHLLTATNIFEEEKFRKLKRGDKILVERIDQQIVRIEPLRSEDSSHLQSLVQEEIALHQLMEDPHEVERFVVEKKQKVKKKEVA